MKLKAFLLALAIAGMTPVISNAAPLTPDEKCKLCCSNGSDEACYSNCLAAENVRLAMLNDQIEAIKPKPASESFKTGTCLDAILNTGIDFTFSVPTLDGIIRDMVNKAMNAACNAVNQRMNEMMGAVNQKIGTAVNMPIYGTNRSVTTRVGTTSNTNTSTSSGSTSGNYPVTTTNNGTTVNGSVSGGSLGDILK